ncbi:putative HNH endonuclease [Acinetobacter phage VB_ApiP_XC38]|uniref:Putative HNH endonuclease n=1 Tax=Acinetobacter phage VB_ApiP_XC38 TaxID=2655002 RepID=A0A5P8PR12_9CAUD|nr:putative HNH endonuclease [Acinetobacter phage VB_ApiP_XC38]QFR59713.1 putative HNH endonuclease [Acinetobacter phage VB_ApiP_XC38]
MLKIIQKLSSSHSLCECHECNSHYKVNHKPSKLNKISHLCDLCSSLSNQVVNQALVKKFFNYDALTGELTWRLPTRNSNVGDSVGAVSNGYKQVSIGNVLYKVHHIIWLYVHGYLPTIIDHDNHNGLDNRLCNLAEVTQAENNRNMSKRTDNSSGHTGIRTTPLGKFVVRVAQKHIGTFDKIADALAARDSEYARLNFNPKHGT